MGNKLKSKLPIISVLILACFVYIWGLWNESVNTYYSAGVFSMGQNLHAFFYNSIDSAGFISIDKPPLGLWIQVLFTKVFGFSGFVMLLPQAICGVLSVYFIYRIINKRFSKTAGIISAIVLTLTPIFAAVSRNNTMDGILILMLVLVADQAIKAAEKGSLKNLIFAGALIGLGFNVKMLQAFMIVPSVYLTYLVFSKEKIVKKMVFCAISVIVMLAISFSWIIAVDLTPAENRPYVGSSSTNSAFDLAFGYNGINRIIGGQNNAQKQVLINEQSDTQTTPSNETDDRSGPPGQNNADQVGTEQTPNGGGINESGTPSITKLLNINVSGQISWFIIPAFFSSLICLYLIFKRKLKENQSNITLFFFTMCFIPMAMYFSFSSGLAHRYYLSMLAFIIAPLVGVGFNILKEKKNNLLLPLAFIITAAVQIYIQSLYNNWLLWVLPVCAVIFAVSAFVIFLVRNKETANKIIMPLMATLFLLPALWSLTPIIYGGNAELPITGPDLLNQSEPFDKQIDLSKLITYLKENQDGATYLATAPSSLNMGAELILQSGQPIMLLGGFNGSDSPLTVEKFKEYIKLGKVKYAVIVTDINPNPMGGNNETLDNWIVANYKPVDMEFEGVILYKLNAE